MSTIGATKGTQVSFSIISTKTTLEPLGHGQTHRNPPLSGKFILSFLSLLSTALLGLDHATKVALGNRNLLFIVRSELWSSPSSWLCRNSLPRYALLWAYGAAIGKPTLDDDAIERSKMEGTTVDWRSSNEI